MLDHFRIFIVKYYSKLTFSNKVNPSMGFVVNSSKVAPITDRVGPPSSMALYEVTKGVTLRKKEWALLVEKEIDKINKQQSTLWCSRST